MLATARRRVHRPALALLVLALAGMGVVRGLAPLAAPRPAPHAHRAPAEIDPRAVVDFSLVLARAHPRRLHRFLAAVDDPRSPGFHRFLDARAFGRRFGVSDTALRRVRRRLRVDGIRVIRAYPQRTALDVSAPAGVVERIFRTRLTDLPRARRTGAAPTLGAAGDSGLPVRGGQRGGRAGPA